MWNLSQNHVFLLILAEIPLKSRDMYLYLLSAIKQHGQVKYNRKEN